MVANQQLLEAQSTFLKILCQVTPAHSAESKSRPVNVVRVPVLTTVSYRILTFTTPSILYNINYVIIIIIINYIIIYIIDIIINYTYDFLM